MALAFYNSLSKKIEEFTPLNKNKVGFYICGPTVYGYATIGNWRTYTLGDIIVRTLKYNGYDVKFFMNITDVGHLTGDNSGDADTGEDRMEKAKKIEGKNAWEIAKFYTEDFIKNYKVLNLTLPEKFLHATEHINEQITLVQKILDAGLGYKINDGIYFDTIAYEKKGFEYGELSNLDQIKAGARVEFNSEKKNSRDFALWKFSPKDSNRDMEWPSPWGVGFPGWHIECSAMSMQYLGDQFDIHAGGEDLKSTHHPNEIAQSQGVTGKAPFAKYWIHGSFLQVDGGRMGKSLGNAYTIQDIEKNKINPLALRYFYLIGHYRSSLNFTWESIDASSNALKHFYSLFLDLGEETGIVDTNSKKVFIDHVNNDLDVPQALAFAWSVLRNESLSKADRRATLLDFDSVLGLNLNYITVGEIPTEVSGLIHKREKARKEKDWNLSDSIRNEINSLGYEIKDTDSGTEVRKII